MRAYKEMGKERGQSLIFPSFNTIRWKEKKKRERGERGTPNKSPLALGDSISYEEEEGTISLHRLVSSATLGGKWKTHINEKRNFSNKLLQLPGRGLLKKKEGIRRPFRRGKEVRGEEDTCQVPSLISLKERKESNMGRGRERKGEKCWDLIPFSSHKRARKESFAEKGKSTPYGASHCLDLSHETASTNTVDQVGGGRKGKKEELNGKEEKRDL